MTETSLTHRVCCCRQDLASWSVTALVILHDTVTYVLLGSDPSLDRRLSSTRNKMQIGVERSVTVC